MFAVDVCIKDIIFPNNPQNFGVNIEAQELWSQQAVLDKVDCCGLVLKGQVGPNIKPSDTPQYTVHRVLNLHSVELEQLHCALCIRVVLITPSSWFKLVPVVFVFLLVYYLRKHLSFLKSE